MFNIIILPPELLQTKPISVKKIEVFVLKVH
jgi:hypothetical protein